MLRPIPSVCSTLLLYLFNKRVDWRRLENRPAKPQRSGSSLGLSVFPRIHKWQTGKRCIKQTHGELHNNLSGGGPLWQSCSRPAVSGPWGVPQERSLASLWLQIHTRAAWFYKQTLPACVWRASAVTRQDLSSSCSRTRTAILCFGSNFRQNVNLSFISVESCSPALLLLALKGEFMQNLNSVEKDKVPV